MLDIKFIRENPEMVEQNARSKGYEVSIGQLLEADSKRRDLQQKADSVRAERNQHTAGMKGSKPSPADIAKGKELKEELAKIETKLTSSDTEFDKLIKQVPNMADESVPVGASEEDNVVVKNVGDLPEFDFAPKSHWEIAEKRDWIDKERAAKVAGSRFAYIKGDLVMLQFAIVQYVLGTLVDETKLQSIAEKAGLNISTKPFVPVLPPYMLRTELYEAMDRLEPRDDRYKIEHEDVWLQGSAEHVLGSMHSDEIIDQSQLPVRYVGYATSFRREAGSYGKDTEGIFRMHQFDKLEMESLTTAASGLDEHLFMVAIQEHFLGELELPYHVVQKCTADIGKPNSRGVDMDVWLPAQEQYRETHTADYMTDYQARRLNTRTRLDSNETELVHTNDATAFALGRIMIAIIENNQTKDGQVRVPAVLQPYLAGRKVL